MERTGFEVVKHMAVDRSGRMTLWMQDSQLLVFLPSDVMIIDTEPGVHDVDLPGKNFVV